MKHWDTCSVSVYFLFSAIQHSLHGQECHGTTTFKSHKLFASVITQSKMTKVPGTEFNIASSPPNNASCNKRIVRALSTAIPIRPSLKPLSHQSRQQHTVSSFPPSLFSSLSKRSIAGPMIQKLCAVAEGITRITALSYQTTRLSSPLVLWF